MIFMWNKQVSRVFIFKSYQMKIKHCYSCWLSINFIHTGNKLCIHSTNKPSAESFSFTQIFL